MRKLVSQMTAAELKEINGDKLARMGVDGDVAEAFLEHRYYSPTKKTYITGSLVSMTNVEGRGEFIRQAIPAPDEPYAFFMMRQAEWMAAYHRNVQPVARILRVDNKVFMQRSDGVVVGVFPLDHIIWRKDTAQTSVRLGQAMSQVPGITGKEAWFGGTVSPLFRQNFMAQGWAIQENASTTIPTK